MNKLSDLLNHRILYRLAGSRQIKVGTVRGFAGENEKYVALGGDSWAEVAAVSVIHDFGDASPPATGILADKRALLEGGEAEAAPKRSPKAKEAPKEE